MQDDPTIIPTIHSVDQARSDPRYKFVFLHSSNVDVCFTIQFSNFAYRTIYLYILEFDLGTSQSCNDYVRIYRGRRGYSIYPCTIRGSFNLESDSLKFNSIRFYSISNNLRATQHIYEHKTNNRNKFRGKHSARQHRS